MPVNSLGFTYCQVPIIYHIATKDHLEISFKDGTSKVIDSLVIDKITSEKIFKRNGEVVQIHAHINNTYLK
jgi:hypothetical protein